MVSPNALDGGAVVSMRVRRPETGFQGVLFSQNRREWNPNRVRALVHRCGRVFGFLFLANHEAQNRFSMYGRPCVPVL